jgi:hypothetical protein
MPPGFRPSVVVEVAMGRNMNMVTIEGETLLGFEAWNRASTADA